MNERWRIKLQGVFRRSGSETWEVLVGDADARSSCAWVRVDTGLGRRGEERRLGICTCIFGLGVLS